VDFNLKQFYHFCSQLKIETKEQGLKKMGNLLGTQTYVMDEIKKGLSEDVHFFVILKGRQLGITTISLALDLYWHFITPRASGNTYNRYGRKQGYVPINPCHVYGWFAQGVPHPDPCSQPKSAFPQEPQPSVLSSRWA
jgi:hypothetical protein